MSTTDAIVVGEGWISEHYFTTDAKSESFQAKVLERRKTWDAEAAEGRPTVRSRFTEARQRLEVDLGSLGDYADPVSTREAADDVHARLVAVLGLNAHGLHMERQGGLLRVSAPGIADGSPLAVVLGSPVGTVEDLLDKDGLTLPEAVTLGGEVAYTSAARLVSALFVEEDAPDLVLVLAGRWVLLAERARWAEGRYLAVDIQLVCERNDTKKGGEIDRALACLGSESIAPDADSRLWWRDVLEESIKHTVGVSQDLRDGVRLSIEIIANEVVTRHREQGLDPLPADQAQVLAKQSLRFLYRILFLLYAEASPELGVLPVGAPEYAQGYSLDRLRELAQVELATPRARSGTHLYDSLGVLFRLVDRGHAPQAAAVEVDPQADEGSAFGAGLTFNSLRADLFRPEATAHIDAAGLGNAALQEVLAHLLLSKESRGKDRGFISYAELGINQLGAVYEGLMSYTGFFAETDLYEVAKAGDASKGSWVVPVDRAEGISTGDFVRFKDKVTGEEKPVLHERGTFVFRLAGRERQQSASYYTPEVLTRFTVGQALEELLDQNGTTTTAAEILDLSVCEPALGSGAFAIEAVKQLAEQYLERRQKELGERIDPDEHPRRLQEVKAYLALHNVYGVDLNATAVELAEISLWLDTMVEGLDAPWFGLHLRRGNSLIGARRAVFRRDEVTSKGYLNDVPRDVHLTTLARDLGTGGLATAIDGGIHHFLLPASGWGSASDAKEAKELAPAALARLKAWRSSVQAKPTKTQIDALVDLSYRVESLWQIALQRLEIAEREIRRAIPIWGADILPSGGSVQREQIEDALADAKGAYQRLRRVMDAWCALWFWPLTDTLTTRTVDGRVERISPPSLAQWIDALQMLLGRHAGKSRIASGGDQTLGAGATWDELGDYESFDLGFASALPVESVLDKHPWLRVCDAVAGQQGFFHWDLDFAPVFAQGGFDLQVGNPPWVRPDWDENSALAEFDVRWALATRGDIASPVSERIATLAIPRATEYYLAALAEVSSGRAFLTSVAAYPTLEGLRPDLYRCFLEHTWRSAATTGTVALIHLESHFTDERAGRLREACYKRLRRHWEFSNELKLFEIQNQKHYGVNIYGMARDRVSFLSAISLYHPDTLVQSLVHDGSGPEPGYKDSQGTWDRRPHRGRIVVVDDRVLGAWRDTLESGRGSVSQTRMVYAVNAASARVLERLSDAERIGSLGLSYSTGWTEGSDDRAGYFHVGWGQVDRWDDAIIQGSHLHVARPMYKIPNPTMKSQRDWSAVDLEAMSSTITPTTSFMPCRDRDLYDAAYTHWVDGTVTVSARDRFRVAWRSMADNVGERTLMAAIIPPGTAHVHSVNSAGYVDEGRLPELPIVAGFLSSLIHDFSIRAAPKSSISPRTIARLPIADMGCLGASLAVRVLRLNCISAAYESLWAACYQTSMQDEVWARIPSGSHSQIGGVEPAWNSATPLRSAAERRQGQVEIDALISLMLGLSADDLCTIYRTQFPVLHGYDRSDYHYDSNGRLVPNSVLTVWRRKADRIVEEERTATNKSGNTYKYELPFATLDREADMRQAYAHFEQLLKDRS